MKILMLNYEYPPLGGGGASVCRNMSEELVEKGNQVDVVTMGFRDLSESETVDGVRIFRVKCLRSKKMVCHPWEQLSYCISAYRYITKCLDIKRYDIIHCHFIIPTGLLALWLKKKYYISYIVTAQGSDVLGHNNDRFRLLYKIVKPIWIRIIKNAAFLTAPSSFLKREILVSYSEKDCVVIPNGVYEKGCSVSGKRGKYIVTLARLQKGKGIQDLISTCAKINMNGWHVEILSDGPYREELEKLVEQYALKDSITFRGYVSSEERDKYLRNAGIFFSGSRFEAMPIAVLEAMDAGCKVLISDIEPHRQLVTEEFIYKSLEDLKKKLRKCLTDTPDGQKYEMDQFYWKNIIEQYEDIYSQVISGKAGER
ncbi:glycosyltransferase family 4 protein [Clostridiaceae bacterium]|nr:glycosyltransferase family 4 protein [Clostridiaceae bacterium]RKI16466.1 glycosyltransferase family 4 protein [bacterium 1XD21-70]